MALDSPIRASSARVWVLNPARAGLLGWLLRYYVFAILTLGVITAAAGLQLLRHYAAGLPDVAAIAAYETTAPGVTRIYAADGALLAEFAREHRSYAGLADIPEPLLQAFLATEDRRFYDHYGLDWRGLARATVANLRSGTVVQGGSTITQQVAKGFLTDDRTLERKLREALLALRLEARLGKDRILEVYLNKIFLGHGAYGVAAAASRYFGKRLDQLTLGESALIAGLARAPSRFSPVADPERALARRDVVLQNLVEAGYITTTARDAAQAEPLRLHHEPDVFRLRAPYYAEQVRRDLLAELGEAAVLGGLQIETAAELETHALARAAIDHQVRRLDRRQGWRGPVTHLPREREQTRLLRRLAAEYGDDPLGSAPSRWRLGLVKAVDRSQATIAIGDREVLLPLKHMAWAAAYNPRSGINDRTIADPREALIVGDVVWVRGVYRPARSSTTQGAASPTQGAASPTQGAAASPTQGAASPAQGAAASPTQGAAAEDDAASDPLAQSLPAVDRRSGLPLVELGQPPRVEAALYTLDHRSGYVTAMVGGADFDRSQYNRATQACRQPGSVFKAIYYALALDGDTYTMASILEDHPYEPEPGEVWNPQNIGKTLDGKVLLRTALIRSLNLPSIRLFSALGADAVVAWARRLGIRSELIADRALSLGASCVHTDELSRAFAIFARGGRWIDPIYVRRIVGKDGQVLLDHRRPEDPAVDVAGRLRHLVAAATEPPPQVIDARTAFLISQLLREVVTAGIGYRAQRIGVPAAGKSGTASKGENTTDTWFVGFTSRLLTAAWMGDDTYERSLGIEDASYTTAIPMWTEYMSAAVAGIPHGPLPTTRPPGLRSATVDARTGGESRADQPTATLFFKE